jgi:hypothetical protein
MSTHRRKNSSSLKCIQSVYTQQLDRDSWNALRAAKRPLKAIVIGRQSHAQLVVMPDGRVIQAGELWVHW